MGGNLKILYLSHPASSSYSLFFITTCPLFLTFVLISLNLSLPLAQFQLLKSVQETTAAETDQPLESVELPVDNIPSLSR
jgi:hypothetical protein